jgi:hypothetical protein
VPGLHIALEAFPIYLHTEQAGPLLGEGGGTNMTALATTSCARGKAMIDGFKAAAAVGEEATNLAHRPVHFLGGSQLDVGNGL